MAKITVFYNFNNLGDFISENPIEFVRDKIEITLPAGFDAFKTDFEQVYIKTPENETFTLRDIFKVTPAGNIYINYIYKGATVSKKCNYRKIA